MDTSRDYRKKQPIRIFINNLLIVIYVFIPMAGVFITLPFAPFFDFMGEAFGFFGTYAIAGAVAYSCIGGFWRFVIINEDLIPQGDRDGYWL